MSRGTLNVQNSIYKNKRDAHQLQKLASRLGRIKQMTAIPANPNTETNNRQEATHANLQEPVTVSAIRNGRIVPLDWNYLSSAEKRSAYVVLFFPCDYE